MLRGLELLTDDEFLEIGELIAVDLKPTKDRTRLVLRWMAKVVGSSQTDPSGVERAVLEWVADRWSIPFEPTIDTNDLERLIRRRIATEATEFLAPAWRVACALMVEDVSPVAGLKFEILTKAAEEVVPSQSVLEKQREEWALLSATWSREDPRPALDSDLETLRQHPDLGRQALRLGLLIALADGRLSANEERLIGYIGTALGLSEEETQQLTSQLNQRFCAHRDRLSKEKSLGTLMSSVEAAEQTLAGSGTLADLASEARENVLHELGPVKGEGSRRASEGWSRLFGALSGIVHFFSSRLDEEAPANLVRIVYLTIQKQRAEIVSSQVAPGKAEGFK